MRKMQITAMMLAAGLLTGCAGEVPPAASDTAEKSSDAATSAAREIAGEVTGEITVGCYDATVYRTFLEDAAKQFEQKYPGTRVHIDCFSEMPEIQSYEEDGTYITVVNQEDDPQGRADYISKTSTALMGGKGADLLAMDVLPVYRYVKAGQLENLTSYMDQDPDFVKSDYRENVLDAVEFLDGTWFLPLDYSFQYFTYDSTLIDGQSGGFGQAQAFTTNQLLEMGKPVYDGSSKVLSSPAYMKESNEDLFTQQFREKYSDFVDIGRSQANFSDGQFAGLLDGLQEMAARGYIPKGLSDTADVSQLLARAGENPTDRFLFKTKNNFSLIQQTWPDSEQGLMISTSGIENGIETDDEIAGIGAGENGTVPFTYQQAYGLNANSLNKATAWAFLKFLLSDEIQSSPGMPIGSFAVHNEARMLQAENLYQMLFTEGGKLDEVQQKALKDYLAVTEDMADQISSYTIQDTVIEDMVKQEIVYFFEGTKTAEEVSDVLQNKVDLYLNE
ncbi:MAG: ABC transporter substrate-binding protein [Lachnospiraceae bacterium]